MSNILRPKVLLIGAGNIAQGFDDLGTTSVKTHVKGYLYHGEFFNLDSVFDIDELLAEQVSKKWGIKNYTSKFSEIEGKYFDVISICTPDDTHEFYLEKALAMIPKVIFIEKPLGLSAEKARHIFSYCIEHKIFLLVNYSRIFLEEFKSLRDSFLAGTMGKVLSATIRYHKGFYHNCSHFFNLLVFLLGPKYLSSFSTNAIYDYSPTDPSISGTVVLEQSGYEFRLNFEAFDQSVLNMTEVDIMFENNRIIYVESRGSWLHKYKTESYFDGIELKEYVSESSRLINYNLAMTNAIGLIKDFLSHGDDQIIKNYALLSLTTTEIMESIFEDYINNKQQI